MNKLHGNNQARMYPAICVSTYTRPVLAWENIAFFSMVAYNVLIPCSKLIGMMIPCNTTHDDHFSRQFATPFPPIRLTFTRHGCFGRSRIIWPLQKKLPLVKSHHYFAMVSTFKCICQPLMVRVANCFQRGPQEFIKLLWCAHHNHHHSPMRGTLSHQRTLATSCEIVLQFILHVLCIDQNLP